MKANAVAGPPPRVSAVRLASVQKRCPDQDDALLRRIGDDDERAFRLLVERHVDRAYALALRILQDGAAAEDVVQDAMLKVWTGRGSWDESRGRFSTWLYRVVTNRCLDLRRQPRTEDVEMLPEVSDGQPDALTTMRRVEVSEIIERAMSRLPDQQRIALILSYTDDLGNAEIAEIMGTSVSAVESLLKRGRQRLRELLRKEDLAGCDAFTDN